MNAVAEQLTGWSSEEAVGRPLTDVFRLVDGATQEAGRNPLALAIALDKAVSLSPNCLLIRRDGHETAIEDSAAPIRDRRLEIQRQRFGFGEAGKFGAVHSEQRLICGDDMLAGAQGGFDCRFRRASSPPINSTNTSIASLAASSEGSSNHSMPEMSMPRSLPRLMRADSRDLDRAAAALLQRRAILVQQSQYARADRAKPG